METNKSSNDTHFHYQQDEEDVLPGREVCKGTGGAFGKGGG